MLQASSAMIKSRKPKDAKLDYSHIAVYTQLLAAEGTVPLQIRVGSYAIF